MNSYRFKIKLIFIYIIFLKQFINCKKDFIENKNNDGNDNSKKLSSISSSFYLMNEDDYKKDDFESEIITKSIEKEKVQDVILNSPNIYEFNLTNKNLNKDDLLIINFYPLDCAIKIVVLNTTEKTIIKKVSNYEYDAFYVEITTEKLPKFKIKPLINQLDENSQKKDYHLVINCFEKNNPKLYLNEKEPTLIYFDSNLDKMTLFYEPTILTEPIVFSFFIKENVIFEAKIMNTEIPKRIIAYKDNIIVNHIERDMLDEDKYTSIIVNKNKASNKYATMIVRVSGENSSPFYLQKNLLNLGFMPLNVNNHYYYMEVFKGEEGEIMIHNKINNAFLRSRIIDKNEIEDILDIKNFPEFNKKEEYNQYNDFSKKLYFSSNETNNCENGCYLLITYYSPNISLKEIDGIEYNLLARVWDENEFKSQIINIPLNEYVFGAIDISSINVHYYSVYIPENDKIYVEIQGRNIKALAKQGIVRINSFQEPYNSLLLTKSIDEYDIEDEKLIIQLKKDELGLDEFNNKYISFVFSIFNYNYKELTNKYYFRVILKKIK